MQEFLNCAKADFELKLINSLIRYNNCPNPISDGCKYALTSGGKRLRPILSYMSQELFSNHGVAVDNIALAIEYVHNYSLVHDDLPCMDNDVLRHGKPCAHVKYGDGMAVLIGDALLNSAMEILLECEDIDADYINAIKYFSKMSGICGMIGGQCIDLASEGKDINLDTIIAMNSGKTVALFKAAIVSTAIACHASSDEIKALEQYCESLGLIFQIVDDILDINSTVEDLGKNIKKDINNGKATYLGKRGIKKSKEDIINFENNAINALAIFGNRANRLIELTKYLSARSH